jgi:hypothetical protein
MFAKSFEAPPILVTQHAGRRAQQRGIRRQAIELLLDNADVVLNAGDDCETWRLSRDAVSDLIACGVPAALITQTRHLALIVADGCRVATVLHVNKGRSGRCHRRQMPTRAAQAS